MIPCISVRPDSRKAMALILKQKPKHGCSVLRLCHILLYHICFWGQKGVSLTLVDYGIRSIFYSWRIQRAGVEKQDSNGTL